MSELSSLFARISITPENYETFLAAKPQSPILDENWSNWWNSRKMYSSQPLTENDLYAYNDDSNRAILEGWKDAKDTGTFYEYDKTSGLLNLGIIFFSENYAEMIPTIAFILSLSDYKENNPDDFVIVYPYFWGDSDINLFIKYDGKKGLLDTKIENIDGVDADKLEYAKDFLGKKFAEIFQNDND